MLEAIEPHVHIDGGFALNLLTGNIPALEEMGKQLKEEEEAPASDETVEDTVAAEEPTEKSDETKAEQEKAEPEEPEKKDEPNKADTEPSVTLDDITRIIVRKIKQKNGNNEKIGQILATYGVKKVSALKPEQYEAFVTDLAAI